MMTKMQTQDMYSASHWQIQTPHNYNASIVKSTDRWGNPSDNSPRFSQPDNVMTELFKECPTVGSIFYKDNGPGKYIVKDSDPNLRKAMSELGNMLNRYIPGRSHDRLSTFVNQQSNLENSVEEDSVPRHADTDYTTLISAGSNLLNFLHYSMSNGRGIQIYVKGDRIERSSPSKSKPQFKKKFGKRR